MVKKNQTAKSTMTIIIFALGSKVLGFIRETLIASKFGSGVETDTFFIALTATALVTGFISNAIRTTSIPIFSEIESKEGQKGKIEHTNNMINIIFIFSILLVIVGFIISPNIVQILAKGFVGKQFELAVKLTRIGLPMILFSGITGVFSGYLQSENRFTSTSIIGYPFNFVYIFFLLFLSTIFGIRGLMVAAVLAAFSQLLIQIPEILSSGYKYKLKFNLKDKYIKKVLLLSFPIFVGVAVNDLNAIVDKTLASSLVSGSISALNYANKLNGLVLGVFISAITTVIFPLLSKEANSDNILGMKKIMSKGINLLLIITVPATSGLIALSTPIVQVAFERGEFGSVATSMTSQALIFYSFGLIAMAMKLLITRVYYSLQDMRTPMINGIISVVFNIVLNIILVRYMGHVGLAFATSISTIIVTLLLLYGLKNKIGSLNTKFHINIFLKIALASGIMGVVSYFIYNGVYRLIGTLKMGNIISLILSAGTGVIVYGVLCYIFGIKEVKDLIEQVKIRLKFK